MPTGRAGTTAPTDGETASPPPAGQTPGSTPALPPATVAPTGSPIPVITPVPPSLPPLTPGAETPAELVVVDQGLTAMGGQGNDFVSYGVVLVNPNPDWAVHRLLLTIDFFDSGGAFIASDEQFVTVLPGQTTAVAGTIFGGGRTARMEIGLPEDVTAFQVTAPSRGSFDVSGSTRSHDGVLITSGELVNRFDSAQTFVQVTVIYRTQSGSIIGGANGAVERVSRGGRSPFDIIDGTPLNGLATSEVYWQLSGIGQ